MFFRVIAKKEELNRGRAGSQGSCALRAQLPGWRLAAGGSRAARSTSISVA